MGNLSCLDNPIWNALSSVHRPLASANGLAARYPDDVSPFAGLQSATPGAFNDLAQLVALGSSVALLTAASPEIPSEWAVTRRRSIDQMICERPPIMANTALHELGQNDVPDMLALAAATEPGPFSVGAIRMGRYNGIHAADGQLIAMAGERLRLDGFTEISAVCTDPEYRGQGLAYALVSTTASLLLASGRTPFLHVKTENSAKALYERIGFRVRRQIWLTVILRTR